MPKINIPAKGAHCAIEREGEVIVVCRFLKTYMEGGKANSMDQNRLHGSEAVFCLLFRDESTGDFPDLREDEAVKASALARIEREKETSNELPEDSSYRYLPFLRCRQCLEYFDESEEVPASNSDTYDSFEAMLQVERRDFLELTGQQQDRLL